MEGREHKLSDCERSSTDSAVKGRELQTPDQGNGVGRAKLARVDIDELLAGKEATEAVVRVSMHWQLLRQCHCKGR